MTSAAAPPQEQSPGGFPQGTATPSEDCGKCHRAIYREFAYGFGADLKFGGMVLQSLREDQLFLPGNFAPGATAHSVAGVDPFPIHARETESKGRSCNVCHYPQPFMIPSLDSPETAKPAARPKDKEAGGMTCASCHLTPDGKIRGPHTVSAPHATVSDANIQTAAMCAYCHSSGKRVSGKQTQTFFEWREDFNKPGLGPQHCQNCHMPKTVRKTAEAFDVPDRAVSRHLWIGGHAPQRLKSALNMVLLQPDKNGGNLEFHIINLGAGHSVPTGSNRRGMYLRAEAIDAKGKVMDRRQWLFAPWYGDRPDDRKFLEEDKGRDDATAAMQADAQGPHENIIRAGEERILSWSPTLKAGSYTIKAQLVYDLNRYNDPQYAEDQTELTVTSLNMKIGLGAGSGK